jgi:hypothetical protein
LGSPWHPASGALSSGARVCLCLRHCGSLAWPDDLIGVAYGQYGDDEYRASSHVSQTLADYFIVMQVDQAGWHRSKELQVPANIRLIEQPAYSPEVNPVEHVWEELREKYLHNRVFPSLDLLVELLCQGLNELTDDQKRLSSMTGFPHLYIIL